MLVEFLTLCFHYGTLIALQQIKQQYSRDIVKYSSELCMACGQNLKRQESRARAADLAGAVLGKHRGCQQCSAAQLL